MQRDPVAGGRKRVVWLAVGAAAVVLLGGGAFAVTRFLRTRVPSEITATELAAAYYADPTAADARFGDKTLTVSGTPYFLGATRFAALAADGDRSMAIPCIALSVGSNEEAPVAEGAAQGALPFWVLPGVVGIFPPDAPVPPSGAQPGQPVTIQGVCKGLACGQPVIIDECRIAK